MRFTRLRRASRRRKKSGFTILEVLVFTTILLMGFLALTSTSVTVHKLRRASDENNTARAALQSMIEEIQRTSVLVFGADPSWAGAMVATFGPGGGVGDTFDVFGLDPQRGAPSVGTIQLITDETLTDMELGVELGMPADLDNDGSIDDPDVSDSAEMLPVIVRVAWTGITGNQEMSQAFYVLAY